MSNETEKPSDVYIASQLVKRLEPFDEVKRSNILWLMQQSLWRRQQIAAEPPGTLIDGYYDVTFAELLSHVAGKSVALSRETFNDSHAWAVLSDGTVVAVSSSTCNGDLDDPEFMIFRTVDAARQYGLRIDLDNQGVDSPPRRDVDEDDR